MTASSTTRAAFLELMRQRILVLDGAMGTMIQDLKHNESAYRGERFKDWPRDQRGNNDVLVLTQAMNAIFVPYLGHAGLALSISVGALINAVWLFIGLKRGGWYRPMPGWGRFALKAVFATLAMSALLAVASADIDWLGMTGRDGLRVTWMAASLGGAALIYFGVLLALGMRPRDFSRRA